MDLQTMVNNAVSAQRAEEMKISPQLTLGELILKLENIVNIHTCSYKIGTSDYKREVKFDFEYLSPTGLSSWRGSYNELSINFGENGGMTLENFITQLKEAIGKEYTGYKGGEYVMGKTTPVWVANYGNSGNTGVVDVEFRDDDVILKTAYCKY